jgi:hypothetical protein
MTIQEYKIKLESNSSNKQGTINKKLSHLKTLEKQLQETFPDILFPELLEQEELIFEHIDNSGIKDTQGRKYALQDYIQIMGLQDKYHYTIDKLKEGKFQVYESEKKKLDHKYPDLKELRLLVEKVEKSKEKLYLNLLLKYNVLRTDLANVKLKNYTNKDPRYIDGVIIYPTLNKVKIYEDVITKLDSEDEEMIKELTGDYLIEINCDAENRNGNYSKLVPKLTEKYLSIKLTQTDLRHIHTNNNFKECSIDKEFIEKYKRISELCKRNGHCLETALETYLSN